MARRVAGFPATPDAVVDIVPCDHVVNAILAVCATEPDVGKPQYYRQLRRPESAHIPRPVRTRPEYFLEHPFDGGPRGAAPAPVWQFPGATSIERLLSTSSERTPGGAGSGAPRARIGPESSPATWIGPACAGLLRRYLASTTSTRSRTALRRRQHVGPDPLLDPDDQPAFAFDTSVFDWAVYLEDVHCPSITAAHPADGFDPAEAWQSTQHDEGTRARRQRISGAGDLRP